MAGVALALLACSSSDFNTPTRLNKVRILAIQADPPQPALGASTTLRALVYQPPPSADGADAAVSVTGYSWSWCPLPMSPTNPSQCPIDPLDEAAANQLFAGLGITDAPPLDLGMGETATFTNAFPAALLANVCANGVGAVPAGADVGAHAATGSISFKCTNTGFPITVVLVAHTSAGDLPAVFNVYLPTNDSIAPNLNPVVNGIKISDRELDQAGTQEVLRNSNVPIVLDMPESSAESLPLPLDPNHPFEQLDISWYAECGDFGGNGLGGRRTGYSGNPNDPISTFPLAVQNTWNIPKLEGYAPAYARITVVVRDNQGGTGRGGVAWTSGVVHLVDVLSDAGASDAPEADSGEPTPDVGALDSEEADSADAVQESAP
jgi:hypothetical protein